MIGVIIYTFVWQIRWRTLDEFGSRKYCEVA